MDSDQQYLVVALYNYDGQGDNQLCFDAEDIIEVLAMDGSGWWAGRVLRTGDTGYFPSNFVEEANLDEENTPDGPRQAYIDSDEEPPRCQREPSYDDDIRRRDDDDYHRDHRDHRDGKHYHDDGDRLKRDSPYGRKDDFQQKFGYDMPHKSSPMMKQQQWKSERPPIYRQGEEGRISSRERIEDMDTNVRATYVDVPADDNESVVILDSMKSTQPLTHGRKSVKSKMTLLDPMQEQHNMLVQEQMYMANRNGPFNHAAMAVNNAPTAPVEPTRLGYWSSNMAIFVSSAYVFGGVALLILGLANSGEFGSANEILFAMYAILFGGALFYYETKWTIWKSTAIPWKAIAYTVGATPLMFTHATYQVSLFMYVVAIVSTIASIRGEIYEREPLDIGKYFRRQPKTQDQLPKPLLQRWVDRINTLRERNELGRTVFVGFTILVNVYVAASALIVWMGIVKELRADGVNITYSAPWAK